MSCYKMIIKAKSHQQVVDIIDKVVVEKLKPDQAAIALGLTRHQFNELYEDYCKNKKVVFA